MSPDECYVVEDAEAGIDAGLAGGFTTIGIGPASVYEKTDYPVKKNLGYSFAYINKTFYLLEFSKRK